MLLLKKEYKRIEMEVRIPCKTKIKTESMQQLSNIKIKEQIYKDSHILFRKSNSKVHQMKMICRNTVLT